MVHAKTSSEEEDTLTQSSIPQSLNSTQMQEHDIIYGPIPKRNTVPIVNEEYNVIFFQVAKAASTEWKRFFMRLQGSTKWCERQDLIHRNNTLKYLSEYSIEDAENMMKDPKWTKAIFVRHPKPRILSAFLDKAIDHSQYFIKNYCKNYERLGGDLEVCTTRHQDFDFFLKNFTTSPVIKDNTHFRTVYSRVDAKWWPYINFIGKIENINDDSKELLNSIHSKIDGVSAWDRIGKSGWGDKTSRDCSIVSESEGGFLGVRDANHTTNATDRMVQYYSPELDKLVEERYVEDIENPYFKYESLKLNYKG